MFPSPSILVAKTVTETFVDEGQLDAVDMLKLWLQVPLIQEEAKIVSE